MGLTEHATRYPYQLSVGCNSALPGACPGGRPEVLLLDEPFSAVDAITRETRLTYTIARMKALGLLQGKEPTLAHLVDHRPIMQALDTLDTVAQ